jgi:hypothetical protein
LTSKPDHKSPLFLIPVDENGNALLPRALADKIEASVVRQLEQQRKSRQRPPLPISDLTGLPRHVVADKTKIPASALLNQCAAFVHVRELMLRAKIDGRILNHPQYIAIPIEFADNVAVMLDLGAKQIEKLLEVLEANDLAE